MTASVFVGTSLDGFIARRNDAFDFLPVDGGEPHGYPEFIAGIDAIVLGRRTFEVVAKMETWPYPDGKRVVVLTHRALPDGFPVETMSGTPEEIVAKLAASGALELYIDGGETIQEFLRAGEIQRITITRVPVLIGDGISLFGPVPHDVRVRHVATRTFASGLVQSEYEVIG